MSRNEKQMVLMLIMVCLYLDMGWGLSFERNSTQRQSHSEQPISTMFSLPVPPAVTLSFKAALLPLYVGIGSAAC